MNDHQHTIEYLESVKNDLLQKAESLETAITVLKNRKMPPAEPTPEYTPEERQAVIEDIMRRTEELTPAYKAKMKEKDQNL